MNECIADQRAKEAGNDGSKWSEEIETIFNRGARVESRVGPETTWMYSDGSVILRQHGFGWDILELA